MNEEDKEQARLRRAHYTAMPRLQRIKLSLANVEGLGILEGIDDESWSVGLGLLKNVLQKRSKGD